MKHDQPADPRESLWRRPLTAAERAALPVTPEAERELELEARLTGALARLPDTPVPSNFTARVLAAVDREEAQPARPRIWALHWRGLLPRLAAVATVLVVGGLSLHQYALHSDHARLAQTVAAVTLAQPAPSLDALENLDVIQYMAQPVHADGELLADLQ